MDYAGARRVRDTGAVEGHSLAVRKHVGTERGGDCDC